jgi:hypothetical protein
VNNVAPKATVISDGWTGYSFLSEAGFIHEVKSSKGGTDLLPHVHLVFSLLKRWLLGTYQGGVQKRYLDFFTLMSTSLDSIAVNPVVAASSLGG